jgi:hypothetical protein
MPRGVRTGRPTGCWCCKTWPAPPSRANIVGEGAALCGPFLCAVGAYGVGAVGAVGAYGVGAYGVGAA